MSKTNTEFQTQTPRNTTAYRFDWVTLDANGQVIDGSLQFAPSFREKAARQYRRQELRNKVRSWLRDIPIMLLAIVVGLFWGVIYCFKFLVNVFRAIFEGLWNFVEQERMVLRAKSKKRKVTPMADGTRNGHNVQVNVQVN